MATNHNRLNGALARDGAGPDFALHQDAWGRLVLTDAQGHQHVGVEPVRAFPLSAPDEGLALCDAEGCELAWIDRHDQLAEAPRRVLEEYLRQREFLPVVRRIVKVSASVEPSEWEVETDRGRTRFMLGSSEHVRHLEGQRALITDANGLRYLIADVGALDAGSRRILERYLS
jgi:hypothetical protein